MDMRAPPKEHFIHLARELKRHITPVHPFDIRLALLIKRTMTILHLTIRVWHTLARKMAELLTVRLQ
jgi:hypothetical protein